MHFALVKVVGYAVMGKAREVSGSTFDFAGEFPPRCLVQILGARTANMAGSTAIVLGVEHPQVRVDGVAKLAHLFRHQGARTVSASAAPRGGAEGRPGAGGAFPRRRQSRQRGQRRRQRRRRRRRRRRTRQSGRRRRRCRGEVAGVMAARCRRTAGCRSGVPRAAPPRASTHALRRTRRTPHAGMRWGRCDEFVYPGTVNSYS
jgi:hypothetical protein